jgi:membrane fusion protein (multidrug efflux system)
MSTGSVSRIVEADSVVQELPRRPEAEAPAPSSPRSWKKQIVVALAALAVAGGGAWWFLQRGIESTDDAQIDGDVINVPARTGGVVTAVHFSDNQTVKKGALLAEIDPQPAQTRLAQAEADLSSAQASADAAAVEAQLTSTNAHSQKSAARASLRSARVGVSTTEQQIAEADAGAIAAAAAFKKAQLDLDRAGKLLAANAVPQAQLDSAQAAFDAASAQQAQARARVATLRATTAQIEANVSAASARYQQASTVPQQIADAEARARMAAARVATANAARDLAALDLSYTKIYAPEDGIVSKRAINVGQMVQAGAAVVALVPTAKLWVTGNFKETQLAHMKPGQKATVHVDALGGELHGTVESFSAATGARFTLLPPDNATGNFTKVVQRVPVRVALESVPLPGALRPGLSVDLAVDTRSN